MRLFVVCFLLFAAPVSASEERPLISWDDPLIAEFIQAQSFDCSRKTCSQIRSCAEACHKLMVCGHTRRDGDGDCIPCEILSARWC